MSFLRFLSISLLCIIECGLVPLFAQNDGSPFLQNDEIVCYFKCYSQNRMNDTSPPTVRCTTKWKWQVKGKILTAEIYCDSKPFDNLYFAAYDDNGNIIAGTVVSFGKFSTDLEKLSDGRYWGDISLLCLDFEDGKYYRVLMSNHMLPQFYGDVIHSSNDIVVNTNYEQTITLNDDLEGSNSISLKKNTSIVKLLFIMNL